MLLLDIHIIEAFFIQSNIALYKEQGMGYIKLKELNCRRILSWLKMTKDKKYEDSIFSFISAWIGFNYYYSTFVTSYRKEFESWNKEYFKGYKGDKAQWVFLVSHEKFKLFFKSFRERNANVFEEEILLPIKNMIGGPSVPTGLQGKYKLKELNDKQIFSVIYQIRNNLFHGEKDPEKDERDRKLSTIASNFMISFMSALIENTDGLIRKAHVLL